LGQKAVEEEHLVKSNQVRTTIEIKISDFRARIAKMTMSNVSPLSFAILRGFHVVPWEIVNF
jgi:hypothetical protein